MLNEIQQEAKNEAKAFLKYLSSSAAAMGSVADFPSSKNVIGVGIGTKVTSGMRITGQEAVRIYVSVKIPYNQLSSEEIIPESFGNLLTDVVEVGNVVPLQLLETWQRYGYHRPTCCGVSIGHPKGSTGTLGCLVEKGGNCYILSNNHVLADCNNASVGDTIIQPGCEDNGSAPTHEIAMLSEMTVIDFSGASNYVDAAIAKVNSDTTVQPEIIEIGRPQKTTKVATRYQAVRKHGRTTGHTVGIVDDISADISINFRVNGQIRTAWFDNQVAIAGVGFRPFSEPGDSGSLIVDAVTLEPVALLVAGGRDLTFANPINEVLQFFGVTIVDR